MAEITNVPDEIVIKFFDMLDLKNAIRFASCSSSLFNVLQERFLEKEKQTVTSILDNIIKKIQQFYADIASEQAQDGMLSFMLRRMIHTTAVYDALGENDMTFHYHSKYQDEFNNVFLQTNEEIEMDVKEFLTYMENAQFEYRGFNIIGLPIVHRNSLNMFKQMIERRYFNEPFKIQTYLAFENNAFIEIIFDGEFVEFDFHMRRVHDGQWIFIDQEINRLNIPLKHVRMANRLLWFHYSDHKAIVEIVDLLFDIFHSTVKGHLIKGAEQTNVSIWNDMYEDNAVLAEAVHNYMIDYNVESQIQQVSQSALE